METIQIPLELQPRKTIQIPTKAMPVRPTAAPTKSMPVPQTVVSKASPGRPTKRPAPSCKPEPTDDVSNTYASVAKEEEQEEIVERVLTDPYVQLEPYPREPIKLAPRRLKQKKQKRERL